MDQHMGRDRMFVLGLHMFRKLAEDKHGSSNHVKFKWTNHLCKQIYSGGTNHFSDLSLKRFKDFNFLKVKYVKRIWEKLENICNIKNY